MAFAFKFPWMLLFASSVSMGLSASSSGCIATDRIEFDPVENFPPSIISQPEAEFPLNEIGAINLDDPPPEQGAEMLLQTIIRDPNLDQTLEFRIFLDSERPPAAEFPIQEGPIEPSGFVERDREFAIPYELFTAGRCHKIELVVVGQFASRVVEPRRPVEPGDIDQVTWWVRVTDDETPLMQECR